LTSIFKPISGGSVCSGISNIDLEKGISRIENDSITNIFYREINKLDWNKLSDKACDDEYFVTIGIKGTVSKVEFVSYDGDKWNDFWYGM
jgi:hypothetical protein